MNTNSDEEHAYKILGKKNLKERDHFEDINFIFENNTTVNVKVVL